MVFGEAPGYWPLTTTVGGTISGYSLMGSPGIDRRPATVRRIASTEAKIGRSMKNEEIFMAALRHALRRRVAAHGHPLRRHGEAGVHALRTVHDDDIARLQALAHDAQTVDHSSELDLAIFDFVIGSEQEHIFLALIGVHGAIVDQDRVVIVAPDELYAGEEPGGEQAVLVHEHGTRPDGAGLRIELVVDKIHRSRVRKSLL